MLSPDDILQGRYRIITELGRGGMGAVYRAWDMRLGIPVAPTATETPVAVVDTPAAESPASETPAAGGFTITMQNQSPDEVCYVLISPSDSDQWGEDWLGGDEVIASGGERTFDVPAGSHDVRVVRCDQATMATGWAIDADTTFYIGDPGAGVGLLVENQSSADVCYVYASLSSADEWGLDWLGDFETLPSGASRVIYIPPGTYDLQATGCDNQVLAEEFDIALTGDFTWTLQD